MDDSIYRWTNPSHLEIAILGYPIHFWSRFLCSRPPGEDGPHLAGVFGGCWEEKRSQDTCFVCGSYLYVYICIIMCICILYIYICTLCRRNVNIYIYIHNRVSTWWTTDKCLRYPLLSSQRQWVSSFWVPQMLAPQLQKPWRHCGLLKFDGANETASEVWDIWHLAMCAGVAETWKNVLPVPKTPKARQVLAFFCGASGNQTWQWEIPCKWAMFDQYSKSIYPIDPSLFELGGLTKRYPTPISNNHNL